MISLEYIIISSIVISLFFIYALPFIEKLSLINKELEHIKEKKILRRIKNVFIYSSAFENFSERLSFLGEYEICVHNNIISVNNYSEYIDFNTNLYVCFIAKAISIKKTRNIYQIDPLE